MVNNGGGSVWMEGGCEVMADSVLRRNAAKLGKREPGERGSRLPIL